MMPQVPFFTWWNSENKVFILPVISRYSGGCHSFLSDEFAPGSDHGIVDYALTRAERSRCE